MKRNILLSLALGVLLCASGAARADHAAAGLLAMVPQEAEVVIGVDVQAVVQSPLFGKIREQAPARQLDAFVSVVESLTGCNLLEDLQAAVMMGEMKEEGQGALLIQGRWDPAKLITIATLNPTYASEEVAGKTLHTWTDENNGKKNHAAFLRDDVLMMSEWPGVVDGLLRRSGTGYANRAGLTLPKGPEGIETPVFIALFPPEHVADNPVLAQIAGAKAGLTPGADRVTAVAEIEADTPHAARQCEELLQGLIAMGQLIDNASANSPWTVNTQVNGTQVKATAGVPVANLVALAPAMRARRLGP